MTKSEAIQQCANDGARLPVPRSDEENEFFFNLQFNKVNDYGGWVGINDDAQEGTWVADNGDELTWFPWGPNEEPGGRLIMNLDGTTLKQYEQKEQLVLNSLLVSILK